MSENQAVKIEPVVKQIKVGLIQEAAFRLFTEGINKWWPLAIHSVGEEQAETCVFEGHEGGRIYETMKDGSQAEWGKVMVWEPFGKVAFTWYPGRTSDTAQEVTVNFIEISGGTQVELVHTGWEILSEKAQTSRVGYDFGWDFVLANYIITATRK
ncbi:MAG: SRPBCC domain-containing protein [Anaerolineales bacterium]